MESESSVDPELIYTRSVSSEDVHQWKRAFDQSERQRGQLSDDYQVDSDDIHLSINWRFL